MFSIEKLGLIAYLNDNAISETNRSMLELTSDVIDRTLDRYLSKGNGADMTDGVQLLRFLNERNIRRDALANTASRIRSYMGCGIETVTYWDIRYPGNLRLVPDPPLLLYVKGTGFPGSDQVAIAGTSNPSVKGLDLAFEYGARIAKKGRTVVSGLTKGVDAQALEGALSAEGSPIAVLGTPLTDIYPEENKVLAEEISKAGAVVSELTEEAFLHPGRFLRRDQMAGGLSGSLVIIESTGVGGIRRLVELMLRQGRKVYVVDQGVFSDPDHEEGFRILKGLGAVPITYPDEVIVNEPKQRRLF
jgi:DNA protecting protein DprA